MKNISKKMNIHIIAARISRIRKLIINSVNQRRIDPA